jgi:4-amino-4-deoxy-L-arabinose transferase-like glycosyltransferase
LAGFPRLVQNGAGRAALAVVAFYVVLATTYSVVNPPWEAPDEVAHFDFITTLLRTRALPVQHPGDLTEAQQTPLYYLIAAIVALPANVDDPTGAWRSNQLFMWTGLGGQQKNAGIHGSDDTFPFQGQGLAMHLDRLTSIVLGLLTVVLTISIGWEVFPTDRRIGVLAGALVAFNPEFLFITSAINNDNLLAMASTGAWWQGVRAIQRPQQTRQWAYLGVWTSAAILAKPSGVVVGIIVALVLIIVSIRRWSVGTFVRGAVVVGAIVAATTLWWFVRNLTLYGDPTGWSIFSKNYASDLRPEPLKLSDVGDFFTSEFHSFWGVFGWMNIFPPAWFYPLVGALCVLGFLGFCFFCVRRLGALSSYQKVAIALLCAEFVAQELYLLEMIVHWDSSAFQGRYLFPAIAPAMLILSIGVLALLPKRLVTIGMTGLALGLVALATYMAFWVIQPVYRVVPLPKSSLWFAPNRTNDVFGDTFALRNYAVQSDGDPSRLRVTLYWQALRRPDFDYSVFVHLIDGQGRIVAQKDQGPGASANYPPTAWLSGDIVADKHILDLPAQTPPGTYRLRVGVYNWATGQQLPISAPDQPPATYVLLGEEVKR